MAPILYGDIQKSAKDIINDEFCLDRKFKLTTKTATGITFTTEGKATNKGVDAKFGAKFKVDNFSVDKLQTTTAGRLLIETSIKDLVPNLKLGFKVEEGLPGTGNPKGSINATYNHDLVTVYSEVDVADGPTLYESVSAEYQGALVGAEIKYNANPKESGLVDAGALVGYKTADFTATLQASKKGKNVSFSLHQIINPETALAVLIDAKTEGKLDALTIGGTYKLDKETSFAGKVNSKGEVTASYSQVIKPSVKLVASASVDTKNFAGEDHKFGLQLIVGQIFQLALPCYAMQWFGRVAVL